MSSTISNNFFLPYQKKWIKDESLFKLMLKSRQIGISWGTAYGLVRRKARVGQTLDAWVSSRDELTAKIFKTDCNAFAGILHTACTDLGVQVIDSDKKITAYVLSLANGVCINSMSSNADAQASKRGDRVLDEFAVHQNPRKLWSIAKPGTTWGGLMEIISTPRGSNNYFQTLIDEIQEGGNPKGFSLHRVTLQDALDQGFLGKLKAKLPEDDPRQFMDEADYFDFVRAGCPDEETFLQEYMCVASDDQSAYFGYDLIDPCTYPITEAWQTAIDPTRDYYIGMDIGRTKDLTVVYIIEQNGTRAYTRRIIEMSNTPFAEQAAMLARYAVMPNVRRICIDATGLGKQLAEEARKRHGNKVEEVVFTMGVKEDLATTLRRAMEDRNILIPGTKEMIADLRSIRKETTSAGNVRFVGERTTNGHADRTWALALALHAAKRPSGSMLPRRLLGRISRRMGARLIR